jgi:hypothetical protein
MRNEIPFRDYLMYGTKPGEQPPEAWFCVIDKLPVAEQAEFRAPALKK